MDFVVENFAAIATILLTAALGAHFLWRNNLKTRRANACAAFRSAVLAELGSIYPNPGIDTWPDNIDHFLRSRFVALQTAVSNFRPFVPLWRRWCFDRAWKFYLKGKHGMRGQHQNYGQYESHSGTDEKGNPYDTHLTYRQTFKRNVSCLLSYAKET